MPTRSDESSVCVSSRSSQSRRHLHTEQKLHGRRPYLAAACMPSCSPPAPLTHPLAVSCLPSQLCFMSTWAAPVLARELSLLPSQPCHLSAFFLLNLVTCSLPFCVVLRSLGFKIPRGRAPFPCAAPRTPITCASPVPHRLRSAGGGTRRAIARPAAELGSRPLPTTTSTGNRTRERTNPHRIGSDRAPGNRIAGIL